MKLSLSTQSLDKIKPLYKLGFIILISKSLNNYKRVAGTSQLSIGFLLILLSLILYFYWYHRRIDYLF